MSGYFWVATILMSVVAAAFLMRPLFQTNSRGTVAALAVLIPLFAGGVYLFLGSPGLNSNASTASPAQMNTRPANSTASGAKVDSVANMLVGLEQRLADSPDDGKAWLLLARSYKHLDRTADAISAYEKAEALGQHDPELSNISSNQNNPWSSQTSTARIRGKLSLSQRAADIVVPTDTVFIFARAEGAPGVPAAVLQRPAADLPIEFALNDSHAMVAGVKLSDFDKVIVTARISRSGDATEALQNLEARTNPVAVADNLHVKLEIE